MRECQNTLQCEFFLLGALGDLACKKLLPAFYQLESINALPETLTIYACARQEHTQSEYRSVLEAAIKQAAGVAFCPSTFLRLFERIDYIPVDLQHTEAIHKLKKQGANKRLFYFAVPPTLYPTLCKGLKQNNLIDSNTHVILEKPIGHDLASSRMINDLLGEYFSERQIFRIDHYLGKETVLNLLALRFANAIFAAHWDHTSIDYVTISIAESVGVEGRREYHNDAGQLRDMVQNHLLQILALIAMEPPPDLDANSVRDEKLKVLKALRPISESNCDACSVRGQYVGGFINDEQVPGYLQENEAVKESHTETFVALRAHVDNWRWSGVPFYMRTGKRMAAKCSEVIIHFKPLVHNIFAHLQHEQNANKLILRLQPDEGICLEIMNKSPGTGSEMRLQNTTLDLSFKDTFAQARIADAYERLLLDAINGNQSWFVRADEVEHAWQWIDGILHAWKKTNSPLHLYESGSEGPNAVSGLFLKAEHGWND